MSKVPKTKKAYQKKVKAAITKVKDTAQVNIGSEPKRLPLAKHYCFTLNNPTVVELASLAQIVDGDNPVTYLCYGKEKATTLHLQGYLESKTKGNRKKYGKKVGSDKFSISALNISALNIGSIFFYYYPELRIHFFFFLKRRSRR